MQPHDTEPRMAASPTPAAASGDGRSALERTADGFQPELSSCRWVALLVKLSRVLAIAAALVFAWGALTRPSVVDEFSIIHSGWRVSTGKLPYIDFFEHHNPLFFCGIAPLFRLLSSDCAVFWAMRTLQLLLGLLIALAAGRLAARAGAGRIGRTMAVFFTLNGVFFGEAMVDVRADCSMVLLGLLALELASRPECGTARAAVAGVLLGLDFCLLQKSVVFWAAMVPLLLDWAWHRRWRELAALACGAAVPVLAMLAWLASCGMLRNWWLFNYPLNYAVMTTPMSWAGLVELFQRGSPGDIPYGLAAVAGGFLCLTRPQARWHLMAPALIVLALLLAARFPSSPYYYLPVHPFLAAAAGLAVESAALALCGRPVLLAPCLAVALWAGFYVPMRDFAFKMLQPDLWLNLARASFVKANSPPGSLVFDPECNANLSCDDFPWDNGFLRRKFVPGIHRLGAPAHPDITPLILGSKPRFVVINELSETERALIDRFYVPCGYPELRILGASANLPAGGQLEVELLSAGEYLLEAPGTVRLDGVERRNGDSLVLTGGKHLLTNLGPAGRIVLRFRTVPAPYKSQWNF